MNLTPDKMNKLRNQLRLIEAQAAILADELNNPNWNVWDDDKDRKLGVISQAMYDVREQ